MPKELTERSACTKERSADRHALDGMFDDLLAARVSASEIVGALDIPPHVAERELRRAQGRRPGPRPAGCTMMIRFPDDDDDHWASIDDLSATGSSSFVRPVSPLKYLIDHSR